MCLLLICVQRLSIFLYSVLCFFNQTSAYEVLISDWSSDVCSGDLAASLQRHPGGAGHADGVDAGVQIIALVLGRDHRVDHDRGDLVIAQPAAEAGAERDDDAAVRGVEADYRAVGGGFQRFIVGQRMNGDTPRDRQSVVYGKSLSEGEYLG